MSATLQCCNVASLQPLSIFFCKIREEETHCVKQGKLCFKTHHALLEKATSLGVISGIIHAAGVPPSQTPPETILKVDPCGTALALEAGYVSLF